ncbi:MAG TPA: ArsA-related P-loop ATPase [Acidimicrobiales bacterium]|nr:ArsA-related P-loop ATPase [Acidimicrobiales bacterium]
MARSAPSSASLDALLAAKEVVVTCGSGGVGKTTTAAAAAAMAAAHHGGRVLVLTVDPARRLANALGLEAFGNVERRIDDEAFTAAGIAPRGELWVAMLDTKQSWDDLVRRHAPDAATRDAILANPLYENITTRFVHSHDYIAMERLYDIHATGAYDLLVVDTPPSRNALDFLDAPKRMAEFFNSRLLRWLTVPYRSRVMTAASRPFYQLADRILGSQFLQDIAEFFILFQTMHDGFVERARAVQRVLADSRTTFVVVSTLEPSPLHEAEFFIEALHDRKLSLGAVVLNKVLPEYLRDPDVGRTAEAMASDAETLGIALAPDVASTPRDVARLLGGVAASFHDYALAATREAEQRAELTTGSEAIVTVPQLGGDLTDLASVLDLGRYLWGAR